MLSKLSQLTQNKSIISQMYLIQSKQKEQHLS